MPYIEHLGRIPKGHFGETSLTFQPPFGATIPAVKGRHDLPSQNSSNHLGPT